MICKRCGAANAETATRCTNCGAALETPGASGPGVREGIHSRANFVPRARAHTAGESPDTGTYTAPGAHNQQYPAAEPAKGGTRTYDFDISSAGNRFQAPPNYAGSASPEQRPPRNTPAAFSDSELERDLMEMYSRPKKRGVRNLLGALTCIALLAGMAFLCWATFTGGGQKWKAQHGMNAPASAYWDSGRDSYNVGEYAFAVNYFEAALRRDPDNYEGLLNLAQALETTGNVERAKRAYMRAISVNPAQLATYTRLITLMEQTGAPNSELAEVYANAYRNTGDVTFAEKAADYAPKEVVANYDSGAYNYDLQLQLASDSGATIYYTLDGSAPTMESDVYSGPITLSEGMYTLRAIGVAGVMSSPELTRSYTISLPVVEMQSFASKPGKYQADGDGVKVIKVNVPEGATVYYTTDGSVPSTGSSMYSDGIPLSKGSYTVRMISVTAGGQVSDEVSAEFTIVGELPEPFGKDDRFISFKVGETTQAQVNEKFEKLLETIGNTSSYFTQVYNFGEVDFAVKDGTPIVIAVRITNSDITGARGTKVGWSADDVIAKFRDEGYAARNGERILYALEDDHHGWLSYDESGALNGIHYLYVDSDKLVELNYYIDGGSVTAMDYMVSDM